MVCPCIVAPYFMLGPLTYLYTYFSQNIMLLILLVLLTTVFIYIYTHPDTIKTYLSSQKNNQQQPHISHSTTTFNALY
jgi:hypothetical protein